MTAVPRMRARARHIKRPRRKVRVLAPPRTPHTGASAGGLLALRSRHSCGFRARAYHGEDWLVGCCKSWVNPANCKGGWQKEQRGSGSLSPRTARPFWATTRGKARKGGLARGRPKQRKAPSFVHPPRHPKKKGREPHPCKRRSRSRCSPRCLAHVPRVAARNRGHLRT